MNEYGYKEREVMQRNNLGVKVAIAVTAVTLCIAIVTIVTFTVQSLQKTASGAVRSQPQLTIEMCPTEVSDANSVAIINGYITDDDSKCTLFINGENVVSTSSAGDEARWERGYKLSPGEVKSFDFEVQDDDGNIIRETRIIAYKETTNYTTESKTIYYSYPSYAEGTKLVKKTNDHESGVNIRKGPGESYGAFDSLDNGEVVTYITNYGNGWYYVYSPNGEKGYISAAYVEVAPPANYSGTLFKGTKLTVRTKQTNGYVNLRSLPSMGDNIIGKIYNGETVTYVSEDVDGWCYVRTSSGEYGYVSPEYVKPY